MTSQIIFLKTKSSPTDPYEDLFRSSNVGFDTVFVPVLEHTHITSALDELQRLIESGKATRLVSSGPTEPVREDDDSLHGGLLITSQRAVEVVGLILNKVRSTNPDAINSFLAGTIVYVVGPATRDATVALGFKPENVLGAHCGSGAILSPYILSSFEPVRPQSRRRKLLFLSGEKRSDIIPKLLNAEEVAEEDRVSIREIPVYETRNKDDFPRHFRDVMEKGSRDSMLGERWIIVFSPSACEDVVRIMKEQKDSGTRVKSYLASIGPTTEAYLRNKLGIEPDAVATSPSPSGVVEAIQRFRNKKSSDGT